MLEILGLEVLPDGRSYVDTVGGSRFRVLKRAQRDGYHTADIEYLEDVKVRGSCISYARQTILVLHNWTVFPPLLQVDGGELELLQSLHDSVYQQAQDWDQRLGSRIREQINRQYGTMPDIEENIQVEAST